MKALPLILLLLIADGFPEGTRAYEDGRFADAVAHFDALVAEAGARASLPLLHNRCLAALQAGDLERAATDADRVRRKGGASWDPWHHFVRGNIAFVRCERAATIADQPEAEPFLFDTALAAAQQALHHWDQALVNRRPWPEARRNVERALWKIDELTRKKAEAEQRAAEQAPPPPEPEPDDEGEEVEEDLELGALRTELTAQELDQLLDRLKEKEQEKRELRRQERATGPSAGRDW